LNGKILGSPFYPHAKDSVSVEELNSRNTMVKPERE